MKVSKELREKYVGRRVLLYPSDTYTKKAIITDLDEFGFTFRFVEGTESGSGYSVGNEAFYNHAKNIVMKFLN